MGERNKRTEAIILTVRARGEQNRAVQVLSPDYGLFTLTLYGGPKSKLRSLVQPFCSGTLYFYDDEAKKARKLSDFDARNCHQTFRESLYKLWAANLAAELVQKTRCAGDDRQAFTLLGAFLDGTDASDENGARLGLLRFLWRYLGVLGVQPDVGTCTACGAALCAADGEAGAAAFLPMASGFACADCIASGEGGTETEFPVQAEAVRYLAAVNARAPREVRALRLCATSVWQLKKLLFHLTEQAAGTKLRTLESGMGILT